MHCVYQCVRIDSHNVVAIFLEAADNDCTQTRERIMKIEVVYQSNFNGCSITVDTVCTSKCEQLEEAIVDRFADDYDDGEFVGSDQDVVDFATNLMKTEFGDDFEVTVIIDNISS